MAAATASADFAFTSDTTTPASDAKREVDVAVPRLKKIAWLLTKRTKGRDWVVGLTFPQREVPCGWERVLQPGDHVPLVAAKVRVPTIDSYGLERLDALMSRVWGRRLGLIVAPAGSGKTTLMSRFAATAGVPVAWYRCESWDGGQADLLRHLAAALAGVVGGLRDWPAVEDAVVDLERLPVGRILLIIDDAHTIAGTSAESALERFIDYAPPNLLTLMASRTKPGFNLSRLRVSGALAEISGEDLRFRSWEVETLFRDFYKEPLPPVELAELARRTDGWAAGLQLFHLATSGKGLDQRRRLLRGLAGGSRLVREYLTRNVLDELPPLLRAFLFDTCVLGCLNGPICNRFLNRTDSEELLQELERRQIFTTATGVDGDYRYHEVLRSHLEHVLVSEGGERALAIRYAAAGRALEHFGAIPEALHAYCRAEDWTAVDRMLGRNGPQLASRTGAWIDALPPSVLEHDPWMLLASARRHRAEGRWQAAIDAYQRAQAGFSSVEVTQICQRERQSLAAWSTPVATPPVDYLGWLRLATLKDPAGVRAQLPATANGQDSPVAGFASLLAGKTREARRLLGVAADASDQGVAVRAAARIGAVVASMLGGEVDPPDLEPLIEDADAMGLGFIARMGRAASALALGRTGISTAATVRRACDHLGDRWGSAVAGLLEGLGSVLAGNSDAEVARVLEASADSFRRLGAPVLEVWCRSVMALALAQRGDLEARSVALKAEIIANTSVVEGPKLFVYAALAIIGGENASQFVELARATIASTGLCPQLSGPPDSRVGREPARLLAIRCFGEFHMTIDGRQLPLRSMKPRIRALLRRLCADAGSPVHREVLQETLWPGADAETTARNLHVAISSLRQALEPGIARGASSFVLREGDSYRLVLPPGADVDVIEFEAALDGSRRARLADKSHIAFESFQQAATLAQKELFPEDGSAEWAVQRRGRVRASLLDVAHPLVIHLLAHSHADMAAQVARGGLTVDMYDDGLWRAIIEARGLAGDEAGARRAKSDYRRMLAEL